MITELKARRTRVQEAAEGGVYTAAEAAAKVAELDRQVESTMDRIAAERDQLAVRKAFYGQIGDMMDHMADWIQHDDPALVNRLLRSLIQRVLVTPKYQVSVEFRR